MFWLHVAEKTAGCRFDLKDFFLVDYQKERFFPFLPKTSLILPKKSPVLPGKERPLQRGLESWRDTRLEIAEE